MARVPQIAGKADVPKSDQYVVDQVLEVFGRVRGPFSILLHSPELAERLLPMVLFARKGTIVEAHPRFVGILATVRQKDAAYVWAAQVRVARESGWPNRRSTCCAPSGDAGKTARRNSATWQSTLGATRADQQGRSIRCSIRCRSATAPNGWSN